MSTGPRERKIGKRRSRIEEIKEASHVLHEALDDARKQTVKRSRKSFRKLWEAYDIACGLLLELTELGSTDPGQVKITNEVSNRMSLTAHMIQSSTIVEYLISSGHYVLAVAVLRHNLETLARIATLRTGESKAWETKHRPANVRILPFGLSKDYGRLSEIVHTSKGEFLGSFVEIKDKPGIANLLPSFKQEWAKDLLCRHIAVLTILAGEAYLLVKELHPSSAIPNFDDCMNRIMQILAEVGYLYRK